MEKKNSGSNAVVIFTIIVFIVSLFGVGFFYMSAKSLFSTLSGYATSTGTANLTVESSAAINFTTNQINWGSGRVNSGSPFSTLNTESTNNVTDGNWTLQTFGGLRIENIGNVNVSLNISGGKTAAQFLGGTSPAYNWKFTQQEAASCLNASGSVIVFSASYSTVPTTTTNTCGRFQFIDTNDTLRIDIELVVPSDSITGALGDTITAVAFPST